MPNAKGKGRKRASPVKRTDKSQSERFIRAAREMGLGDSSKDFDKAMDKIVPKKPKAS